VDRRRRPRGVWQREVVALDRETDRALHTLMGSDLSVGGLRVEPHPLLRIGDRLRLALHDGGEGDPLLLEARVAHDEGRRGVGLVFVHPSDEARARLYRMVAELPPLSSLSEDGEKEHALVMGEILSLESSGSGGGSAAKHQQREPQHDHGAADDDDHEA
jgi:hypothetical protein